MANSGEKWVTEAAHGFGTTLHVTEKLYEAQSPYQHIAIYETEKCGRLLLLDGIIQLTEYDEFAYQEMMAHVPLFAHPDPRNVLVIGGGDGGVLREIVKHECVQSIDICEIDAMVIAAAKEFLPSLSCGYDDPRVHVHVMDAVKFIEGREGAYDVIVVDSTDPVGPGEGLFNEAFYTNLKRALKPNGVVGSQAESLFLFPEIVQRLTRITKKLFASTRYANIWVPTYPTGGIGICVATRGSQDVTIPQRPINAELQAQLRYYNPTIHHGAFALPEFANRLLAGV